MTFSFFGTRRTKEYLHLLVSNRNSKYLSLFRDDSPSHSESNGCTLYCNIQNDQSSTSSVSSAHQVVAYFCNSAFDMPTLSSVHHASIANNRQPDQATYFIQLLLFFILSLTSFTVLEALISLSRFSQTRASLTNTAIFKSLKFLATLATQLSFIESFPFRTDSRTLSVKIIIAI